MQYKINLVSSFWAWGRMARLRTRSCQQIRRRLSAAMLINWQIKAMRFYSTSSLCKWEDELLRTRVCLDLLQIESCKVLAPAETTIQQDLLQDSSL